MKIRSKRLIILFVFVISKSAIAQSLDKLKIYFAASTKEVYFYGEPIVMDVVIQNDNDQEIAICNNYIGKDLYSITYDKNINAFVNDSTVKATHKGDAILKPRTIPKRWIPLIAPNLGCPINKTSESNMNNGIVPGHGSLHYSLLIADLVDESIASNTIFSLSRGKWEITVFADPHIPGRLIAKHEFEIVFPNPIQAQELKKYTNTYVSTYRSLLKKSVGNYRAIKPLQDTLGMYEYFMNAKDEVFKEKAFINLFNLYSDFSYEDNCAFFLAHFSKIKNDALLIHMLNKFVDTYKDRSAPKFGKKMNRIEVYNTILQKIKNRNPEISENFINTIVSQSVKYRNGSKEYRVSGNSKDKPVFLSNSEIKQLKNFASESQNK